MAGTRPGRSESLLPVSAALGGLRRRWGSRYANMSAGGAPGGMIASAAISPGDPSGIGMLHCRLNCGFIGGVHAARKASGGDHIDYSLPMTAASILRAVRRLLWPRDINGLPITDARSCQADVDSRAGFVS